MQKRWLNEKDNEGNYLPDENGDYVVVIENSQGSRVSTFKGKTMQEVVDALGDSQVHANREISRLRKPDAARPQIRVEPKDITPADRLRLSNAITDPSSVVEAVEEIVTKRQGIAPDKLGAAFGRMSREDQDAYYGQEATAFREENPDFYPVPQNRDALFDELSANGWDLTRNNLAIVFQTLKDRGDVLIPWPDDSQAQQQQEPIPATALPQPTYINGGNGAANGQPTAQPAPSPRPRSISTGIRNSDASASPPPPPQKKKYTRADIERMSRAEYNDKLRSDPDFRRQVDAMGA